VIAVTEKSTVVVIFVTSKDGALHYLYATNKEASPIGRPKGSFGTTTMSGVSIAISSYSASRSCVDGCRSAGEFGAVGLAAGHVRATLFAWADRCRRRREALTIDARTLADIGLTPGHVTFETAKPFWRA
jgi:uncharacterized protein YjiS (DUF1127 family)